MLQDDTNGNATEPAIAALPDTRNIHSLLLIHSLTRSLTHSLTYTCARQAQQAQLGLYRSNQLSPCCSAICFLLLAVFFSKQPMIAAGMTQMGMPQKTPLLHWARLCSKRTTSKHCQTVWGLQTCGCSPCPLLWTQKKQRLRISSLLASYTAQTNGEHHSLSYSLVCVIDNSRNHRCISLSHCRLERGNGRALAAHWFHTELIPTLSATDLLLVCLNNPCSLTRIHSLTHSG